MNTTANNKLIAEFMSFKEVNKCVRNAETGKYYDYHANQDFSCIKEDEIQIEGEYGFGLVEQDFLFAEDLKFHSDWNWLMPVVEKIVNIKDAYAQERQKVFSSITPNINTTYTAVVNFIKWYNLNK